MPNSALRFLSKTVRKLAVAGLVAALTLVAYSLFLYGQDRATFQERRAELAASIAGERARIETELGVLNGKRETAEADLAAQQKRYAQSEKVLKSLHELDPGALDRVFGDKERRDAHEAQVARMETIKVGARTRTVELQQELVGIARQSEPLLRSLENLKEEERIFAQEERAVSYFARMAWHQARWLAITVFAVYLLGDFFVAVALYYGWAPWVARGRPMRLGTETSLMPVIGESTVVAEDALWPGETAWVRRGFLQSADEGLIRRQRFILNWSTPFSCLTGRLFQLIELRNGRNEGERRVVFANGADPFAELANVAVPEGGSFVLRSGFVMACIANGERMPRIRRRWRFFYWQSWLSGQFGYFEFSGPCRLVVSCVSALQVQQLASRDDGKPSTGRAFPSGVVGFTPRLDLKPVRSGSFWRYCRGQSPLFETELSGAGLFLTRQTDARGGDGFRACVFRCFGI